MRNITKKIIVFALAAVMVLGASACGEKEQLASGGNAEGYPNHTRSGLTDYFSDEEIREASVSEDTFREAVSRLEKGQAEGMTYEEIRDEFFEGKAAHIQGLGVSYVKEGGQELPDIGQEYWWFMDGKRVYICLLTRGPDDGSSPEVFDSYMTGDETER